MSIHQLAVRLAESLAREVGSDHRQEARMAFGLELLIGESVKFILILFLAWILGILPEVITIIAAAGLLRLVSGGEHCSEYYRCLIGGTLCFLLLGWLAHALNPLPGKTALLLISFLTFLTSATTLWKFAPGDTANKPITAESEKLKFKRLSLLMVCGYLLIMLVFTLVPILRSLAIPLALGMVEQVFTVTPWGYRFLHFVDHLLGGWKGSESNDRPAHTGG